MAKAGRKLQRTETDACQSCDIWDQDCTTAARLAELMKTGLHLDVVFCPHLRPPLGGQRDQRTVTA